MGTSFMASPNPMATLQRWAGEYGDVVYYEFFGLRVYLLIHPRNIEEVLLTRQGGFTKGMISRFNPELFGNGLLTSDGDFWRRQRQLSNPAFHRESIVRYSRIAIEEADILMSSWRAGQPRNIHEDMMHVTLRIVSRALFGSDLGVETRVIEWALDSVMRNSSGIHGVLGFLRIPTPRRANYLRAVSELDRIVYDLIARGREKLQHSGAPIDGAKDLLTLLLLARDEDGARMTDQQLRDEVITLLLAGHETTALAVSWTWYLLAQNPDTEQRLHAEIDGTLHGRSPSVEDLPKLPYTDRVLREALRLYPPAWRIGRTTTEPFEIAGYTLPIGANLLMSQWVTHRDPRWFPEPERFNPDRWAGNAAAKLPRFAYFPFGGGPRVCIGAGFAMMEATLLLAAIAQRFRLQLVPGQRIEPLSSITLRPKQGIHVTMQERHAALTACSSM